MRELCLFSKWDQGDSDTPCQMFLIGVISLLEEYCDRKNSVALPTIYFFFSALGKTIFPSFPEDRLGLM